MRDLPGILPTRQRRSQETTVALLEAAAVMLRERSLDELSIEDLCDRVGVTIGAFYGRFEGKDAFFNALMSLAVRKALAVRGWKRLVEGSSKSPSMSCAVMLASSARPRSMRVSIRSDGAQSAPPEALWSNSPHRYCLRGWAGAESRRRRGASASRFR